ncbi:hypothetical protein EJ04DRAFT_555886 [Polyplosphaeria fusca]|uniref:Uncharacterized protein n=1 Tax=Polyplosphaeria fusca TaxID=682080 RepID=A0A9P4QNU9_9PLEO|nr:hypothetical protein EJ04DRAFT_555886 [Polyplosphaeria fusca]
MKPTILLLPTLLSLAHAHFPLKPSSPAALSSHVKSLVPRIISTLDIEGHIAHEICTHDYASDPQKCTAVLVDGYRVQAAEVLGKAGLQGKDGKNVHKGDGKREEKRGRKALDPVQMCIDACVQLKEEQCEDMKIDTEECDEGRVKEGCVSDCKVLGAMFAKRGFEGVKGMLERQLR